MRRVATILLVGLLGACGGDEPVTAPPTRRVEASAPTPTGPVTQFDGRYTGMVTLQADRTRACPPGPTQELVLTVTNGRAALVFNPQTRQSLSGTVGQAGDVRMADIVDRNIATSGLFSATGFNGTHRNGLCNYSVQMRKT